MAAQVLSGGGGDDALTPTRGLLGEGRGEDIAQFGDHYGRVRVWHFGRRVGVLECSGGLVDKHARFIVDYFDRHLDRPPSPRFGFGNWLALTAYTTDVRKILTDWQVQAQYDGLFSAQTSKLLAMSVSLANMVLEHEIQTFARLEDVHHLFHQTMMEQGLGDRIRGTASSMRPIR